MDNYFNCPSPRSYGIDYMRARTTGVAWYDPAMTVVTVKTAAESTGLPPVLPPEVKAKLVGLEVSHA